MENPELHFFRRTPDELPDRPSLASSLQSFESCLFLIALLRYPHALVACVFAIESALKARFGGSRGGLGQLVRDALGQGYLPSGISEADLNVLRETRNRIVHEGYSPKDDDIAAGLFLKTGLPFLSTCYSALFNFDLVDSLAEEFGKQIKIAKSAFDNAKERDALDASHWLRALGHLIRWSLRESLMSQSELKAAEWADVNGVGFDVIHQRRQEAERRFEPSWTFDCPVCRSFETFVVQLDEEALDEKQVIPEKGICVECDLRMPPSSRELLRLLCAEQTERSSEKILRDYGIN